MDHKWNAGKDIMKEGPIYHSAISFKAKPIMSSFHQSDWACLLANTSEGKPHQNKSLIVVPMDAKGITKSAISKMGMHVRLSLVKL